MAKPSRPAEHKQTQVYGLQAKPGTSASQLPAHTQTPMSYYAGPEPTEAQSSHSAMCHHAQSFHVKSINDTTSNKHIKPLWLSVANEGIIHQIECEIDSGAGCNVMPLYLHRSLFGDKELMPTSVQVFGYGESPL